MMLLIVTQKTNLGIQENHIIKTHHHDLVIITGEIKIKGNVDQTLEESANNLSQFLLLLYP